MLYDMKFIVGKTRGHRFESGQVLKKSECGEIGKHGGEEKILSIVTSKKSVV